ncbi:MAG: GntR family transcriptional regulator [Gemmatimonadales bacterium]|nr:GntR family transcriptional regulator [Gemmatimonadales bacterium]
MNLARNDSDPLYRQIADQIGYAIATGRLAHGAKLPPLREAQGRWGVHLHTVRRAYLELRDRGMVTIGRHGAVVLSGSPLREPDSLRDALAQFLAMVRREYGAGATDIAGELARQATERPVVAIVECSLTLATSIGAQVAAAWQVQPIPRLVHAPIPPDEPAVTTYFHRVELRSHTPCAFVRIAPSLAMIREVVARVHRSPWGRIIVCETDPGFAERLVSDICSLAGGKPSVTHRTPSDINRFLTHGDVHALKLVSPRHWDSLDPMLRQRPDVMALQYVVSPPDLDALGGHFGWRPATPSSPA